MSAFGFSGTNAHVVLEQAPSVAAVPRVSQTGPQLLVVSGATPEAARRFAHALARRIAAPDTPALLDLACTLVAGRAQLGWRIAVVAADAADAIARLEAAQPHPSPLQPARVAFALCAHGLPPVAVLQALYSSQPVFRAAIDAVGAQSATRLARSLVDLMLDPHRHDAIPLLHFAIGYAMCRLLAAWGIEPCAFVVEGAGEDVAACVGAAIGLPAAIERALRRGPDGRLVAPPADALLASSRVPILHDFAALDCSVLLALDATDAESPAGVVSLSLGSNGSLPDTLAALHREGCRLAPHALRAAGGRLLADVPVYPFDGQRHWVESVPPRERPVAHALAAGIHPLLGAHLSAPGSTRRHQATLSIERLTWLADHRVAGVPALPAAAILEIFAATEPAGRSFALEEIEFTALLELGSPVLLHTECTQAGIAIHAASPGVEDWRAVASATRTVTEPVAQDVPALAELRERIGQVVNVTAFHEAFRKASAIAYGTAFQTIVELRCGVGAHAGQALARLALPPTLDAHGMRLHPVLLDGVFQSVGAAIAGLPLGNGAYLPAGIQRFTWTGSPELTSLWAWTRARLREDGAITADIDLLSSDGRLVARAESLRLQPGRQAGTRRAFLHDLAWRPAEPGREAPRSWHLIASGDASGALLEDLARRLVVRGSTMVAQAEARAVVFAVDPGASDATQASTQLLQLAQSLVRLGEPPQLWIVTRGESLPAEPGDGAPSAAGAATWGFAASLRLEHPELSATVIDIPRSAPDAEFLEQALSYHGAILSARPTGLFVRHAQPRASAGPGGRFALRRSDSGRIQDLEFLTAPAGAPGPGEVGIAVAAAGLNFRDVMNVLGTYPGNAGEPGGECAGYITALGEDVVGLRMGQPVMAITAGCHGSHVVAPASLVLPLPRGWTMEQAGTSPTVFLTAAWALRGPGRLAAGQRVLVHAGSGGLGLAAIAIARAAGADVLATAGSEEKRGFLRSLGVDCVSDSRSLAFVDAVGRHTQGSGVDIVVNSLSGELIGGGFSLLREGGRFLEVGKAGIWTEEQARACRPDVTYHRIALDESIVAAPQAVAELWRGLLTEFDAGALAPLPVMPFAMHDARSAYRIMQQARHIGRVALTRRFLRAGAAYLVTGGTGALGLATARWLVERGAGQVVLVARRPPDARIDAELESLFAMGSKVRLVQADVASRTQVEGLVADLDAPLAGVIHAAGALDDGVLLHLTPERMRSVFAAKVLGALHLDAATRRSPLDFFVLYSSAAGVLGSAGQANYAAANAALDGIAGSRRAQGLHALSVDWGAWAGGGLAVDRAAPAMASEHALAALEELLRADAAQALVLPVSLATATQAGESAIPRAREPGLKARLAAVSAGEQRECLRDMVRREAATILTLAQATLDVKRPLKDYGLDSLMAVELRNALAALSETRLPSSLLFDYPNIDALSGFLVLRLGLEGGTTQPGTAARPSDAGAAAAGLSEQELAAALKKELERAGY